MNIFARELVAILERHGKKLENLYRLQVPDAYGNMVLISQGKITRLRESLTKDITATLTAEQLEQLQQWVPLDGGGQELRHLRAALVAEAVRSMMSGRTDHSTASQIGDMTLRLLLEKGREDFRTLPSQLLDNIRGTSTSQPVKFDSIERALEPAAEVYEQGLLWLEIARDTMERGEQQGFLALAKTLFTRGYSLAKDAPQIAQSTSQQTELLASIDAASKEVEYLL